MDGDIVLYIPSLLTPEPLLGIFFWVFFFFFFFFFLIKFGVFYSILFLFLFEHKKGYDNFGQVHKGSLVCCEQNETNNEKNTCEIT
jgi:hypothetical protein